MYRAITLNCLLLILPVAIAQAGLLSGPVLDEGVTAELVDIAQIPASAGSPPLARISVMRESPDNTGRLFMNDLRGPLHVIDQGTVQTYMDLKVLISDFKDTGGLQMGFVSFAFHPDFASNGFFYTVHTEDVGATPPNLEPAIPATIIHHSVLTEWQASNPAANTFSGSSRDLMRVASPHPVHNLGEVSFDPNVAAVDSTYGLLYVAAGDFGSVQRNDPAQVQRLDTVYGCLLRIDPLGIPFVRNATTFPYGIPTSNPFADDVDPSTFGEIFAYGFRNPQNFDFDPGGSGSLVLADIGESNLEELNFPAAGTNHGWPLREGTYALDVTVDKNTVFALPPNDSTLGYTYPVAQYDHEEGIAIAGGFAVRQGPPSALLGKYVFGDIVTGRLFYSDIGDMLDADDGDAATTAAVYQLQLLRNGSETTLLDLVRDALGSPAISRADLRFSTTSAGQLYVTTKQDGFVRELVPTAAATPTPAVSSALRLRPNQPNPFNPTTVISFFLPTPSEVSLAIYDVAGRIVRELVSASQDAGEHQYTWNGTDTAGREVSSGVYYYRLVTPSTTRAGKMSVIR